MKQNINIVEIRLEKIEKFETFLKNEIYKFNNPEITLF